jgi:menaquinone-dependent protoporphyrinogen oxidase
MSSTPRPKLPHHFYHPPVHITHTGKTMARILVAYASKKGSTTEIAQVIGKELLVNHIVDVEEMGAVTSLDGYNAVVIGGPMYMGKMVGDVGKFVRRHYNEMKKLPVAGFIVSLAPVSKDPAQMANAQKALHAALDPLRPVVETIFGGKVDPAKLSWFQNWITKKVKTPVGDFRDWTAIATWAKELPVYLDV